MKYLKQLAVAGVAGLLPGLAAASGGTGGDTDLTGHWVGLFSIAVFVLA